MPGITLSVCSAGYLLQADPSHRQGWRVHSRFARVLNLVDDHGALCTLLPHEAPNQPTAMRLTLPEGWDWRTQCDLAAPVLWQAGWLHSPGWQCHLTPAMIWQPQQLQASADTRRCRLEQALLKAVVLQGVSTRIAAGTPEYLGQLITQADASGHALLTARNVNALVGYGQGLTPDGDDYLVGYLAALQRIGPVLAAHTAAIGQQIKQCLGNTNQISAHYLQLAISGHFSESIHQLRSALIEHAPPDVLVHRAEHLLRYGATSGLSTLAGFLHGLRAITPYCLD
ncbi:DUF2877 domain-containing protein [Silvimonas amylolytica]|uniref:DUF2877 domain-containing protein n=1 Tax=Silvimonas amylolytica TaxID=449663 RepID=A0ABQ2PK42_9NEIS|nr:DUF2877 domain-containing protein [Silvimonas amylolytica]GGP25977.1 hypothetical protein GCM10010971_17960 [Silvimonas amylolytica]